MALLQRHNPAANSANAVQIAGDIYPEAGAAAPVRRDYTLTLAAYATTGIAATLDSLEVDGVSYDFPTPVAKGDAAFISLLQTQIEAAIELLKTDKADDTPAVGVMFTGGLEISVAAGTLTVVFRESHFVINSLTDNADTATVFTAVDSPK